MPAPTYIISRVADPIFAVAIGISAAVTRINREEKEKGKTGSETIEVGLRYVDALVHYIDQFISCCLHSCTKTHWTLVKEVSLNDELSKKLSIIIILSLIYLSATRLILLVTGLKTSDMEYGPFTLQKMARIPSSLPLELFARTASPLG